MTEEIKLKADIREEASEEKVSQLRRGGRIPAILYGPDTKNVSIIVDEKAFKGAISTEHGENALIKLTVGGKKPVTTIVKEIQVHPVTTKIIHIDFCQINLAEKVEVEVPLEFEGEAPGVKEEGGVLEHIIRKIRVRCLPTIIPDKFELDVSGLRIGDVLKIKDISAVEGVEILADPEAIAVNLVAATEFKEPEEAPEQAEPEVIGKEKKEEEAEAVEPKEKKEKSEAAKPAEDKKDKKEKQGN
ncbi:MAG: 50S ribosomal protein L25 [Elusimicrobia bacterium]|nr:50S ribosomal protein L25 [Elusimicrobiota bacterium]